MHRRPLVALPLICTAYLLLAFGASAQAQNGSKAPPQARDLQAWLLRIHEAAARQNFQGTFVVSGGGNVVSARMAHFCEGTDQFERIESLDGQARNVFRHNDLVHTVWPTSRVVLQEQRAVLNSFPALLQGNSDHIGDWYDVQPQGEGRVAGHEAYVLIVKPKDAYRYGYGLWSDKGSGLLLRVDVLGDRGEVLETAAFSDIAIGVRSQPETVLRPMKRLEGYRVLRPTVRATRLELEGWTMRQVAPGFRLVSCVYREMDNAGEIAEAASHTRPVLQTVYADGMTYVSVFIEPYTPKHHSLPAFATVGATQTLSLRLGDWWVTAVGDTPVSTLRIFAHGLERRK